MIFMINSFFSYLFGRRMVIQSECKRSTHIMERRGHFNFCIHCNKARQEIKSGEMCLHQFQKIYDGLFNKKFECKLCHYNITL